MASESVTASVLTDVHTLKLIQRDLPPPGPGEVRVSVKAVGLCGSDLHYYHLMRNGDVIVREPMTLGHEGAGVVEAVGPDVAGLQPGDRVALELSTPCGHCRHCEASSASSFPRYNLCGEMQFAASARKFPHCQGVLQRQVNRPAAWCFPIPDSMSFALGALLEPLAVAVHAYRRAGLPALVGQQQPRARPLNVLVIGAGPVGLLCAAVTRYSQQQSNKGLDLHITMIDLVADRVAFATSNGFADVGVVLPKELLGPSDEDVALEKAGQPPVFGHAKTMAERLVHKTANGEPYDVTFECTGQASSMQTAIFATIHGGTVAIVGMGAPSQTIPVGAAASKEVDLKGVFRYAGDYPEAIRLVRDADADQRARLEKIISHTFAGLDQATSAFEQASKPYDDQGKLVLKVVIEP